MKKFFIILMILALSMALIACGQGDVVDNSQENENVDNADHNGLDDLNKSEDEDIPVIGDVGKEFPMSGLYIRRLDQYSVEIQVFGEPRAFVLADDIRGYIDEKKVKEGDKLEFTYYKNYGKILIITSIKKAESEEEIKTDATGEDIEEGEAIESPYFPYEETTTPDGNYNNVPFEDPHGVIALEIFEATGIYGGQIDSNFIEIEIEGEPQEFMLSEEMKAVFNKKPPKEDTTLIFYYYIDKDNILVINKLD